MSWQNKMAKEKDNGKYAVLGMMSQCASYFNVDIHSECVKYIVETYLECIDTCDFFEWIRGANPEEQVIVMDKEYLKENFNDLLSYSEDLEVLSDLFMYLYQQEVAPASTASLAVTFLGRTLSLYFSLCDSKSSKHGIETTLASIPSL